MTLVPSVPALMPVVATGAPAPSAKLLGLLLLGAGAVAAIGLVLPWLAGQTYLGGSFSVSGLDLAKGDGESVERFYPAIAAAGGAVAAIAGLLHLATGRAWTAVLGLAGGAVGAVVLGLFFAALRPDDAMWAFVGTRPVEMLSIGFWMTAAGDGAAIVAGLLAAGAAATRRPATRTPARPAE